MNRRNVVLALALACGALLQPSLAGAQAQTAQHARTTSAHDALAQVLAQAVQRGDTPGLVGLVVDRNGVIFAGAAGKLSPSRPDPMAVNAIFNIASMTKPVTSVAIMMLLEQRKLALEDSVSKYLPGFDNLQVITKFNEQDGTYETRPAKRPITLRHLLTHTSGIGYGFSNPIVARLQQGNSKLEWELPLLNDPGDKWNYSASTRVLGLVVEKITGQTLEDYYQKNIFQPLGMVDTSFAVAAAKQARVVMPLNHAGGKFEERAGQPIPSTPTPPYRGDGGLYSTVQDYGRFMQMLLNGGRLGEARILTARSVRLMGLNQIGKVLVTEQPAAIPALTKPFPLGAGRDKFGLGFQISEQGPDSTTYRRPGSLSWAGIFNTEFWVDPKTGIGGVLMMQFLPFYDDGAIRALRDFEAEVYKGLAPH